MSLRSKFSAERFVAVGFVIVFVVGYTGRCLAQQKSSALTNQEQILTYDTEGVQLEGTLIRRVFYGPPGFGETPRRDARERVLVLKLIAPITVKPVADAEAKNSPNLDVKSHVHEVQLFMFNLQPELADKLLSKHVIAIGSLDGAIAPGQHTDVTMDVKSLRAN